MSQSLYIIGAGGFGREVFTLVTALNRIQHTWTVVGFVDDAPSARDTEAVAALGSRVVGNTGALVATGDPVSAVIAIGSPAARRAVATALQTRAIPVLWPRLVHPDATIGPDVTLGEGTVIAAGARLSTNIVVGRHVQIDQNVTVGHDARIEDFSRLNPQACVSGSVEVAKGALIGANATVLAGLSIGAAATVGAGAVVVRDVSAGQVVKGVPAQ